MRVLMLVSFPEFGGTETHVLSLAREMRNQGIQVGIATCGGPFVQHFRQDDIPVYYVRKPDESSASETADEVVDVVKNHEYDIVHAHDYESFHMLPFLREDLPDIPLLMTVHSLFYSKQTLYQAGASADRIIVVSPVARKRLISSGVDPEKITYIPNGIDIKKYCPSSHPTANRHTLRLPAHKKILLYCGRFQSDKWKIAKKVILAAEQIALRDKMFIAVLVGYGSYRKVLAQMAKQVNRRLGRTAIYVLPATASMERYYHAATLVVGTGRVALEAMSCGKPVIAAGAAGYVGIISPKTLDMCVAKHFGDHAASTEIIPRRLAINVKALLANPKRLRTLGNYGRRVVVERFSVQQMANLTYRVYSSV